MEKQIPRFMTYLMQVKNASKSTMSSYERDLKRLAAFLAAKGIHAPEDVTATSLNSYILFLEREGFSTATVSRNVASMKAFFHYLCDTDRRFQDPTSQIRAPRIDRKAPEILTVEEVESLLEQPDPEMPKGIRDKAMLELLYATGMRVTELITLKTEDLNQRLSYVICRDGERERVIPYGPKAREALEIYLGSARKELLKEEDSVYLFVNCSGHLMSRQGFWKLIKQYAAKAGIETDITPHTIRHSFAAHLVQNGADLKAVQEMMGHADITTTQTYLNLSVDHVKRVYAKAHPRG
ncbi:Tyrosine recombinase XerD [uncultured Clostridium sp.]|nr:Tyrosine recombinase XerD [uncultured Clostridium sp.]